jgi:hypothetical protein
VNQDQIDRRNAVLYARYVDGVPVRVLAQEHGLTATSIYHGMQRHLALQAKAQDLAHARRLNGDSKSLDQVHADA